MMECRTAIVGSGVAGSIVAKELLDAGESDIVLVEAGGRVPMRDRRVWLDHLMSERDVFADHRPEVADAENVGKTPFSVRNSQLRARGGATIIWHGISLRLNPEDLQLHSRTGVGEDWPISYKDLEPHYARAERTLQVAGDATDADHPPRSSPFPLPAFPFELDDAAFIEALERRGASVQHQCISRNSAPIKGRAQCEGIGTCRYCPIDGRFTGDQLLEDVAARSGVRVLSSTAAIRLSFVNRSRAVALETADLRSGALQQIEAQQFVICGGGIESPKILLNSRNQWWPEGVGNHAGHLGRYFFTHPLVVMEGYRYPNPDRVTKELGFPTATSRYYDDARFQREGKFSLQCWGPGHDLARMMIDGAAPSEIHSQIQQRHGCSIAVFLDEVPEAENQVCLGRGRDRYSLQRTRIHYTWSRRTQSQLQRVKSTTADILNEMGCESPSVVAERPAAHPMGTCRTSQDDNAGVVDPDLRIHGVENVYVCSSAVFPTGGAVNPTLTIAALAHRLGEHLARPKRKG